MAMLDQMAAGLTAAGLAAGWPSTIGGISLGLIGLLIAGGLASGLLAGLFGIGGGGVLVPVLHDVFRLLGVPADHLMHMAVGTSLAIMIPTSFRSYLTHRSKGGVDMDILRRMAVPIIVGVVIGTLIARVASGTALKWLWIVFLTSMSAKLLFGRDDWRLGDHLPKSRLVEAYGVFVGVVSTLLSIGGGAFMTMFMTLYNRPLKQAIGTSSGCGPLISIPGMLGFMWAGWPVSQSGVLPVGSVGYVNVIGAVLIMPLSVMMAPVGARLAQGLAKRTLEIGLGCFMLSMAVRFAFTLLH
jgi:uncharacterized protein